MPEAWEPMAWHEMQKLEAARREHISGIER